VVGDADDARVTLEKGQRHPGNTRFFLGKADLGDVGDADRYFLYRKKKSLMGAIEGCARPAIAGRVRVFSESVERGRIASASQASFLRAFRSN
jgi:hypothetical protein